MKIKMGLIAVGIVGGFTLLLGGWFLALVPKDEVKKPTRPAAPLTKVQREPRQLDEVARPDSREVSRPARREAIPSERPRVERMPPQEVKAPPAARPQPLSTSRSKHNALCPTCGTNFYLAGT